MKKLKISLKVGREDRFDAYLELMNGILKLTPTQLKVLAMLIRKNPKSCTPKARQEVTQTMGFKNVAVTNNFIKVLRDKGIITKNEETGLYEYNSSIIPPEEITSVEFAFE